MELRFASAQPDIERVRQLFEEYAASLDFELCFQNFSAELASLPGDYALPAGCLLLAIDQEQAAGCIALRPLHNGHCEMKRLYVRPAFRGLGIGNLLARAILDTARRVGYQKMYLDTVKTMTKAQSLYESLGFVDTQPYYHNPIEGARFMARVI